jgi:hypothetical protein
MALLTLAGQLVTLERIWYHYVDHRPSPLQYDLIITKQEATQLACVVRYADCALDSPLLEARIRSKDAVQRSLGLLWQLLQEWKQAGLVRNETNTPIAYLLQNITHVGWDREQLTITGGASAHVRDE